jgi:hypothetical protein
MNATPAVLESATGRVTRSLAPYVRYKYHHIADNLCTVCSAFGTDRPVVKPLTSMPGIVGGADQDCDVPEGLVMDCP